MSSRTNPKHRGAVARGGSARQRGRHASSYGDGFGRFAGITTLALLPGAGLIATGRRRVGFLLLLLAALVVAALAVIAVSGGVVERVLSVAVSPDRLLAIAVVALIIGAIWCLTIMATAWRARPERPSPFQGVVGLMLVVALCATVAAPSAKGAQLAMVQRDLVNSVFANQGGTPQAAGAAQPKKTKDPWKGIQRVNVLLVGSDAGVDRTGVRSDSMLVASINTKTGEAVLIGLPRNLENVPFPEANPLHALWPNGFNCGNECLLNAVWQQAEQHKDLFKGNANPGLTTTRDVIGEITGLRMDGYVVINMAGFKGLVNAMGGVVVTVPRDLPIGGHDAHGNVVPVTSYVKAGHRRLGGEEALWYSRSRLDSDDYDRMRRQRCMIGALVDQSNPVKLLSQYGALANVLKKNLSTDIQQDDLQAWVTLVQRIQHGKITSLPFTQKVITPSHPDFEAIRAYVQQAVNPQPSTPKPSSTSSGTATKTPKPSNTNLGSTDSTTAQNVKEVC